MLCDVHVEQERNIERLSDQTGPHRTELNLLDHSLRHVDMLLRVQEVCSFRRTLGDAGSNAGSSFSIASIAQAATPYTRHQGP